MAVLPLLALVIACSHTTDPPKAPLEPDLPTPEELADAACPTIVHPYFYRIEKAGAVSYLLGTRHVSVSLAKFPAIVLDRLRASKLFVAELVPGDIARVSLPALDLRAQLGATTWEHLVELVGPEAARSVEHRRPLAALQVMDLMYEDVDAMLDKELAREATALKIPTRGLETAAAQDEVLGQLADPRLVRAFVDHAEDRRTIADDTFDSIRDYCNGTRSDPRISGNSRARLLAGGYRPADIDAMDDRLVFARNTHWIDELASVLAPGNVFVAVGVDHVLGDRGIPALLAASGYVVTRVP